MTRPRKEITHKQFPNVKVQAGKNKISSSDTPAQRRSALETSNVAGKAVRFDLGQIFTETTFHRLSSNRVIFVHLGQVASQRHRDPTHMHFLGHEPETYSTL